MPKAIIFDVDGTLVDSVDLHAQSWREAFADFGHDIDFEAIRSQIGKGGDQLMPVFLSKEELATIGKRLEKHRQEVFKSDYLPGVAAFPQVRELFERLRADGRTVMLASSAKEEELDAYKRIAHIEDLVHAYTTSDDAERSKPYPDIFQAALNQLSEAERHSAIVVGDSPFDAEAAARAGLRTIGMLCGGFAEKDLREAGCIAIYKDPADLLQNYDTSPLVHDHAA